jgi:hypothetical protein
MSREGCPPYSRVTAFLLCPPSTGDSRTSTDTTGRPRYVPDVYTLVAIGNSDLHKRVPQVVQRTHTKSHRPSTARPQRTSRRITSRRIRDSGQAHPRPLMTRRIDPARRQVSTQSAPFTFSPHSIPVLSLRIPPPKAVFGLPQRRPVVVLVRYGGGSRPRTEEAT